MIRFWNSNRHWILTLPMLWAALVPGMARPCAAADQPPLNIVVMDPLALPLSCVCVEGHGQRRYEKLAAFLEPRLGRPIRLMFEEGIDLAITRLGCPPDVIIGQHSVVRFDAARRQLTIEPLTALTDPSGRISVQGLFVAPKSSPIRTLADLKGRRIAIAPAENEESHAAALETMRRSGIEHRSILVAASADEAAVAMADGLADAAVIADFMPPLLEGCGKIQKDFLRVVGLAAPTPFITVFTTSSFPTELRGKLRSALAEVSHDGGLLIALESKSGFVDPAPQADEWTDWRGPGRRGVSAAVPGNLPDPLRRLWSAPLTGPAVGAIAATRRLIVVPDKDSQLTHDVFRCFDAMTGGEAWTLKYPAAKELDYTNAPRASPVIQDDRVYLLGALGDLHCLELQTGRVIWKSSLASYGGPMPTWGWTAAPLVVDDLLIVNPGAPDASLVALNRHTGQEQWRCPGAPAAYASFIVGDFGGVRQIVGYDDRSVGGWEIATGKRLWTLIPGPSSDFNVTTPLAIDGKLLLSTENNLTRLHGFDDAGRIVPQPLAVNQELGPDTCSPVFTQGRLFAAAYGSLFCLDPQRNLQITWTHQDDLFHDHVNLIAGDSRLLAWTIGGDLLLIGADSDRYQLLAHRRPFNAKVESMSSPAIVGDRLYLRSQTELICLSLAPGLNEKSDPGNPAGK